MVISVFIVLRLKVPAILALIEFCCVKITALLFSAFLSVTGYRAQAWIIKDLIAALHGSLAIRATRVEFSRNPFRIV